jgi:hypothetical protein
MALTLTTSASKDNLTKAFFEFYILHKLECDAPYDEYEYYALEFLEQYSSKDYSSINTISFLDPTLYEDFVVNWSDDSSKLIFGLDGLVQVTKNVLGNYNPEIVNYIAPTRQISPSLNAYIPFPHNKLDIKYSLDGCAG